MSNRWCIRAKATRAAIACVSAFLLSFFPLALRAGAELSSSPTLTTNVDKEHLVLQTYKPVYGLIVYDRTLDSRAPGSKNWEMQFQLSFKVPILPIPYADGKLAFGYTQVSFWQVFNIDDSAPFRETNYAPELMASFKRETRAFELHDIRTVVGAIHESNGRAMPESRSWNRLYAEVKFDWDRFTLGVKPWYRIPEGAKSSPADSKGDDNRDILRYMGYGELSAEYRTPAWTLQLMGRDNLRSHQNYGAFQIDLRGPIKNDTKWYVQYFDGYGASLIDYNRSSNRVGIGVLLEK
jgi:phospholipase A1